jgi:hypothetical protein
MLWWSKMDDINWLDEVPMGVEGLSGLTPNGIDQLDNQAQIWATIRNAVIQAYAEGYNNGLKDKQFEGFPV